MNCAISTSDTSVVFMVPESVLVNLTKNLYSNDFAFSLTSKVLFEEVSLCVSRYWSLKINDSSYRFQIEWKNFLYKTKPLQNNNP